MHKTGSGLGTGKVGNGPGHSGGFNSGKDGQVNIGQNTQNTQQSSGGQRGLLGGKSIILIILAVLLLGGGGGGLLSGLFGGSSNSSGNSGTSSSYGLQNIISGLSGGTGSQYSGWSGSTSSSASTNSVSLDRTVAAGSRAKYTKILGNGKDTFTLMIYMCGTDLESKSGMATADLREMAAADISDKLNIIVYTGGCTGWKVSGISNTTNQIYKVQNGSLQPLVSDAGNLPMTSPSTLQQFIQWTAKNFPANRYGLIFWDHGGGSVTGYGYDQRFQSSGAMDLAEIDTALKNGGIKYDFVGFDACLMATLENALMLSQYADYMIGSEETEPGIGWYYTNWVNKLSANTSMATIDIAQIIIDDFVTECNSKCAGQKTTLSVVDLAELENTVPAKFTAFSQDISKLIKNKEYNTVAEARSDTREFAQSSRIDQVDLIDLVDNLNSDNSAALKQALKGAIKYNRTSSSITNAYGLSIYFPYQKISSVDTMVKVYKSMGMDSEYTKCIQEFASVECAGQAAAGGNSSPISSLFGLTGSQGGTQSSSAISALLNSMLGASSGSSSGSSILSGLGLSSANFLSGRDITVNEIADYVAVNQFDASNLQWQKNSKGDYVISMSDEQWGYIRYVDMNVYYDDGEGYIDLGLDNVFDWDDDGNMIGIGDHVWLSINGQPVAFYRLDAVGTQTDYTITGYVPAMLNGDRVELIIVFEDENPDGRIAGARFYYAEGETDAQAKSTAEINDGDEIRFLCDYYDYNGEYSDTHYLGDPITVQGELKLGYGTIKGKVLVTYLFTDIYGQQYWTPVLP